MHLAPSWWVLMLRGIAAICFGIAAAALPGLTLTTLVWLFAAFAAVDGIFSLAAVGAGYHLGRPWWSLLADGLVGILFGIFAFVYPGLTLMACLYLVAAWALVTGVFELVAAV